MTWTARAVIIACVLVSLSNADSDAVSLLQTHAVIGEENAMLDTTVAKNGSGSSSGSFDHAAMLSTGDPLTESVARNAATGLDRCSLRQFVKQKPVPHVRHKCSGDHEDKGGFGVMLPKTGSCSLTLELDAVHEYDMAGLFESMGDNYNVNESSATLDAYLHARRRIFLSKFDCRADVMTMNFLVTDRLCQLFPTAKFYNIQRNVYQWLDSLISYMDTGLMDSNFGQVPPSSPLWGDAYGVRSASAMARSLTTLWCEHEGQNMPRLRANCSVVEPKLSSLPSEEAAHRQEQKTDLWDHEDVLAVVRQTIASHPACNTLPDELLDGQRVLTSSTKKPKSVEHIVSRFWDRVSPDASG